MDGTTVLGTVTVNVYVLLPREVEPLSVSNTTVPVPDVAFGSAEWANVYDAEVVPAATV